MAVLATFFFAAALAFGLAAIVAMLGRNAPAIARALRMEIQPAAHAATPVARVTRVRRSIRPRSAVASAQWRAAA